MRSLTFVKELFADYLVVIAHSWGTHDLQITFHNYDFEDTKKKKAAQNAMEIVRGIVHPGGRNGIFDEVTVQDLISLAAIIADRIEDEITQSAICSVLGANRWSLTRYLKDHPDTSWRSIKKASQVISIADAEKKPFATPQNVTL